MAVKTITFSVKMGAEDDIKDITSQVEKGIGDSKLSDGVVIIFARGSTGGVTTIENESGVLRDLSEAVEKIAPSNRPYHHDARWGDGNGFSHVRSALIGPSLTVPFARGELLLGTWQQIVLLNFDNRSRQREVVLQIIGE